MKNKIFFALIIIFLSMPLMNLISAQDSADTSDEEFQVPPPPEEMPMITQDVNNVVAQAPQPVPQQIPQTLPVAVANPNPEGNKITLDIKGMDIVDVLKMLSNRSGMNIIVGKNVTGRVTLFLKDVSTWEAFEIILSANDLAFEKKGDIINVMTQRDYELIYGERYKDKKETKVVHLKYSKAVEVAKALNQIKTNIGKIAADEISNTVVLIDSPTKIAEMEEFIKSTDLPIQTRVFALNYSQADKILTKIQDSVTKGFGSIKIDERSNKIVVSDYPDKLDELEKAINAFDEKPRQVLIDAQIIEIKPSDKFEMGVDWNYWIQKYFQIRTSMPIGNTGAMFIGTPTSNTVSGQKDYKAVIDLLRTIGEVNVLSSPRIVALNNQEAKILVGTKDAYITSTTSQGGSGTTVTSQSVNFVDSGIKLFVTPTINKDNVITMKIKPEVSSVVYKDLTSEDKKSSIPIVTTSESETTLMIKDGVTIIMGGLKKETRTKNVSKIPLIGDIPGLGFLFRKTSDNMEVSELVILLTPHIVTGDMSYSDFKEVPPKDGVTAKMVNGKIFFDKTKGDKPLGMEDPIEYKRHIYNKVRSLIPKGTSKGEKGEIKVSFVLDNQGQLSGAPKIVSSTNPNLDAAALKCISDAAPFPPLPLSLDKGEETFQITLEYK